jgi:hypothetical protein
MRRRGERGYRVVLPPVVEQFDMGYAVVDGVHRLYALHLQAETDVSVLVVEAERLPALPSRPREWDEVHVRRRYTSRKNKFKDLRLERFRPTASYLRSNCLWFPTFAAMKAASAQALTVIDDVPTAFWCRAHGRLDQCEAARPLLTGNESSAAPVVHLPSVTGL